MNKELNTHTDNEQLTPELICELLTNKNYEHDATNPSMIRVHGPNGVFFIFTEDQPWFRISRPATVRESRDIAVLQKAIDIYRINLVKCRLINNKQGGYAIEAYIDAIEPSFGHFRDTIDTYFYLLDKAFMEISELYEKILPHKEPDKDLPKATVPADKKYNLKKNAKIFFWTYLVQIAVFSLFLLGAAIGVVTEWAPHTGTALSRAPLFWYSMLIVFAVVFVTTCITFIQYKKNNVKWINLTIGIGIVLLAYFVIEAVSQATQGLLFSHQGFRYNLFMISVNLAYIGFLIKYRANYAIAQEKVAKGEQLVLEKAVDPKLAKILFSIGAYSLCIEIGFACAVVVPSKVMSIIGAVLIALVAFIILYFIFGNVNDLEEYIE